MFTVIEKAVLIMATLRLLSGSIEIFAGFLMLRLNDIEKALIVNSSLALVGPIILVTTTTVGLFGVSEKLSFFKIACIFLGVALILIGIKSK
ncbi:YqhV family protein [Bacillus sp. V5-8f]|uniref:YqhV family protein n=1 Tax=Bacillus sp. V5-8f TaxID=2053044 RepID=UPI0015E06E1C|nr:YqhV family protein [Bacillus sp. V5-8f]